MKIKYFNPDGTETVVEVPDDVETVQVGVPVTVETEGTDWSTPVMVIAGLIIVALAYILD